MASLMNGLSAAGGGLANFAGAYGLEAQKSDAALALQSNQQQFQTGLQATQNQFTTGLTNQKAELEKQQAILADSLATARESSGRVQADALLTKRESDARVQAAALANDADTPELKLLRALGALPARGSAASSGAAAASGAAASGAAAPSPSSTTSDASGASPAPSATTPVDDMRTRLIEKTMGLPMAGSEASIRSDIMKDINSDPNFKYAKVGEKSAELEKRLAIAKGVMTDPASQEALAEAISNYQSKPLDQMAMMKGGGPETMALVYKKNPDYQETRYPEVVKTMSDFGSGKKGDIIRAANVGVQHLDVMDQAVDALNNKNVVAFNQVMNSIGKQFGVTAANTFDGLKQIVATEIEKSVAGGIGTGADRERLQKSIDSARTPDQLKNMLEGYRSLMAGQVMGLKSQYEDGTPDRPVFRTGQFAFEKKLMPATIKALKLHDDSAASGSSGGMDDTSTFSNTTSSAPSHPPLPPGFRVLQ